MYPWGNESRLLSMLVRNKSGDVSKRPASVIRNELKNTNENNLQWIELRNASLSSYRERRKQILTLPKRRGYPSVTKNSELYGRLLC